MTILKIALSTMVLAFSAINSAQADVLDLGLHGANIFAVNDFTLPVGSVGGSIVAGRNVSLGGVSVNGANRDAYGTAANADGGYAVIAGGNLTVGAGSISNGKIYAGGTSTVPYYFSPTPVSGTAPASLSALAGTLTSTSSSLSQVAPTGSTEVQWNTLLNVKGSNKSVEVFNLTGRDLSSTIAVTFSNIASGATLIFNISGTSDGIHGGQSFGNYNVLLNFYEATSLYVDGAGFSASILAPLANFSGGGGSITGNVVVNNWNSTVTLNPGAGFSATAVQGFTSPVPEPQTCAMLLAGMGLVGFMARRREAPTA